MALQKSDIEAIVGKGNVLDDEQTSSTRRSEHG